MRIIRLLEQQARAFAIVDTEGIRFDPAFRAACETNACGFFGACWMCPPDVGELSALRANVESFDRALVFQTVQQIADSFDIEGMQRGARAHNRLIVRLRRAAEQAQIDCLLLGAGACGGCSVCARRKDEPCAHPERAVIPLEAAGIDVSQLAWLSGLPYMNGKNTVTYFGALLFHGAIE